MKKEESSPETEESEHRLRLRALKLDDYADIKRIMDTVYHRMGGAWSRKEISVLVNRFPEGQICIEDKGQVIGAALTIIVDYSKFTDNHNYSEITGKGKLDTHDPDGDTLYGIDLFVDPEYRGMRLGRRLYDGRKEMCADLNLRRMIVGGRIPGYHEYKDELTIQEYISKVKNGEIYDPVLSFQLANDFHVRRVIKNYIPEDKESGSYATLLEWINIYYEDRLRSSFLNRRKTVVRIGAVQWQMRIFHSPEDVYDQVEYFVDAIAGYNGDFVLLPEFFNGPLMAGADDNSPSAAIRHLATFTEGFRDKLVELALAYNINIIAGSMPLQMEDGIHNVSYLCRRDGTWASQDKIHITPDEKAYWGLQGGDTLTVFETDIGKIGILICYDVEFPELPRLLAQQGMKILFVPFWTDTRNAYLRVRRTAQARAIENECYVVITGSVGNLPKVENMDIQYSQAAMFSPSDFSFPHDAIIAEATPNTEMTLVSDLDMDLLKELRYQGSVQNFRDRRLDLYRIDWLK